MVGFDVGIEGVGVGVGFCLIGFGVVVVVFMIGWEVVGVVEVVDIIGLEVGVVVMVVFIWWNRFVGIDCGNGVEIEFFSVREEDFLVLGFS